MQSIIGSSHLESTEQRSENEGCGFALLPCEVLATDEIHRCVDDGIRTRIRFGTLITRNIAIARADSDPPDIFGSATHNNAHMRNTRIAIRKPKSHSRNKRLPNPKPNTIESRNLLPSYHPD